MYIISKEFSFEASHRLTGLPTYHPCSRHHGHSYKVILTLKKPVVDEVGFVRDYRTLDVVKNWIEETLDHRHLNDVLQFNPTAENIARHIYEVFSGSMEELASVTVKETGGTAATYEPFLFLDRQPNFTR